MQRLLTPLVDYDPDAPPPLPGHCLNCGTELQGKWCHACGQHDFDFRRSFWHTLKDGLEHLFHVDGRFVRSVVSLLFKPGIMTAAFLAGKRASQVPPLRFYLFISLVFFLTLPLRSDLDLHLNTDRADSEVQQAVVDQIADDIQNGGGNAQPFGPNFWAGLSQAIQNADENRLNEQISAEEQRAIRNLRRLRDRFADPQEFVDFLIEHAPNVIFFSLPLVALFTRVLFRRAGFTYLEHLVIALHLGAFFFIFTLIEEGWSALAALVAGWLGGIITTVAGLYAVAYPPLFFFRVFRCGIFGTIWRSMIFTVGMTFLFVVLLVAATIIYAMAGG